MLKKSSGAVSTTLLILGGVLIVFIVVIFFVIKMTGSQNANKTPADAKDQGPPPPVYETSIGDITFTALGAENMGTALGSSTGYTQQNLTTKEKFIKVTIGVQNQGKLDLPQGSWGLGNIIDSDGRNFTPITYQAYYFLPQPNLCGTALKPAFASTPCVGLYEVAKVSTGLKLYVSAGAGSKRQSAFLDLDVK